MSFFKQLFDPVRRFEREYAEHILNRFQVIPWPGGTRVDLSREFIPVRGLEAALVTHRRIILTGNAGEGKTTTLAHLAATQARLLSADKSAARIPIFLAARDFSGDHLPEIADLPHALNLSDTLAAQCPKNFFAKAIADKRALVLIDDIDLLPLETIDAWLAQFGDAQVVATGKSLIPEGRFAVSNLAVYPLPGFRDDDIQSFTEKWSRENAAAFVATLKSSVVPRSLTANALTLTLLTRVWNSRDPLPTRRTVLFDMYARQILTDGDETVRLLEEVALATLRGNPAANGVLAKSRGFLRLGRNRTAEFTHDLWHAYFAARALRRAPQPDLLSEILSESRWQETVVFYAGLGDASELAQALVARGNIPLAGRVVAHARQIRDDLRDSITLELVRCVWDGDLRAMAALAEMNSDVALESLAARLKDKEPRVRLQAAQILGALRLDRAIEYLLPQLRDVNGDVRDQVLEALGKSRTDRVIEPLLVALRGDPRVGRVDTRLRIAAAKALGQVGSDKAVPALIVDLQVGEPEVRAAAAESLKRITSPLMFKSLTSLAQSGDEETRRYAVEILAVVNGSHHAS